MIKKFLLCGASAAAIICASTAYAATFSFGFTGQAESGAIETSGTYELRLRGGDGGGLNNAFITARGGFGALLMGEIDLLAGDLFRVLVGGDGVFGGGGGGLSYFSSGSNLAIAGGGGGASGGYLYGPIRGYDALGLSNNVGRGGDSTYARTVAYRDDRLNFYGFEAGGGGAGWTGNGYGYAGGNSRPNWTGGSEIFAGSGYGGFGGGGGAGDVFGLIIGGGGAGASGGGAGFTTTFYSLPNGAYYGYGNGYGSVIVGYTTGGQGGSSYFSSAFENTTTVLGQGRTYGAYLTLDLVAQPAPVPLPATAALLGSTIVGMGFAARRRRKKS